LGNKTSVFQAEIEAINRAAQDISSLASPGEEVLIFSDSQSAIKAIFKSHTNSKTVYKCVQALNNLQKRNKIAILWVKAHVGIQGNELADTHAKNGIKERNTLGLTKIPISSAEFQQRKKASLIQKWNHQWFNSKDCRQTKIFYQEVDLKKSEQICNLPRDQLSRLIRFTTGHNSLRYHQNISNKTQNTVNECRFCQMEVEDSEHIIAKCETLWQIRSNAFYKPFLDTPIPWTMSQLINFINNPKIKALDSPPGVPAHGARGAE
jgi:ribonuclease HI